MPSSQSSGALMQPVAESQLSVVQALPSLQDVGVVVQPVAGLQLSVVQALPSLQVTRVPVQTPEPSQASLFVQASASLQAAPALIVEMQP
jgi:hypothetical protein